MALVDLGCPGLPRARAPQPPWTGVDPGMWAERQLISLLTHLFLHNNNTLQICYKFLRVKPISFDMRTFHASDCVDACCKVR